MTKDNNIFLTKKITNEDIYKDMQEFHRKNTEQHDQIIKRLDTTNGKVKLGRWIATTALTLTIVVLGFLISHINK